MWSLLVLSLPTENATARMRAWRALKTSGAAVLRDGVYLLPALEAPQAALQAVADDVRRSGGTARVLRCEGEADFESLFDRGADYAALLAQVAQLQTRLPTSAAVAEPARREVRKLRRAFEQLRAVDFFPGAAQPQAEAALGALEAALARALDPDEPAGAAGGAATPRRRAAAAYRGRVWATRRRPWIDRLASAWLIKRFIDPQARFLWLARPADCPAAAVGFDFDGAEFSHEGDRVTFETLLASFALQSPALQRLGRLVHALDVGGELPPEAAGVEQVLGGMRDALADDDQLLLAAAGVFEGLHRAFEKEPAP
jgi:hypothetical protein